jgi:hypothetical protein
MLRLTLPLSVVALLLVLSGCAGAYDPRANLPTTVSEDDSRAVALNCLTTHEGLEAQLKGEHQIVVGDAEDAPRVRFYLTGGESEAAQFEGKAEGSEQIGATLLFVGKGSDDELKHIEYCLDHL